MRRNQDRRGRRKWEPFVKLEMWILRSPAYQSLSVHARAVLVELLMVYNGQNNGTIGASVRRLSLRCGIAKDTASKALGELQERGFIECTKQGAFSLKLRHASEWRLTWLQCNLTNREPSKAFMRWSPEIQNTVLVGGQLVRHGGPKIDSEPGPQALRSVN